MAEESEARVGGVLPPRARLGLVARAGTAPAAGGAVSFSDRGGPVLQSAKVLLIFWGTSWTGNPPVTSASIIKAVQSIVGSPYMDRLHQYRAIGRATVHGSLTVSTPVGSSPADPPHPFSDGDVSQLLTNLVNTGALPSPVSDPQLLYVVFMPPGVGSSGTFVGEHSSVSIGGANCHYAWLTNAGTLNGITSVFSHELVEAVTDPEGSAIIGDPGTCSQSGWCEIADICTGSTVTINGVVVQRYWSQADNTCAPTDQQVKDQKDSKDTKDTKEKESKETKEPKEFKDVKDHKPEWKEYKEPKEFKDVKDHKSEWKEHKDYKEPKEFKDVKDHKPEWKEQKEFAEGGLAGQPSDLSGRIDELAQRVARVEEGLASGRAFIRPEERPPVGEQAVSSAESPGEDQAKDAKPAPRGRRRPRA
jgi:hypothetical protein